MFKHVLNTRLLPAPPHQWSIVGDGFLRVESGRLRWRSRACGLMEKVRQRAGKHPGLDLASIFVAQQPRLVRFLRRTRSPADAEDTVQRSFLRMLLLDADHANAIRSVEGYLRRTATNLARDDARGEAARGEERRIPLEDIDLPAPDPVACLEARDMLRRLEDIVSRMPARRREIFLAHRVDGYSYAEIAASVGISVKGVEKHMSRAIATVDRLISRQ